jgi:hypothetical protein
MAQGLGGTKRLTASGEVGSAAGKPVRIYSFSVLSGASAGVSTLKDGGASGTTLFTYTCAVVSTDNTFTFGEKGRFFPNGCYWTKDANSTDAKFDYEQEF